MLFYSVEGTISKFNNVVFRLEDIYLMDKGSKVYTGYELDEELVQYRMKDPKRLKWKIGHIHSHHSMKAYFSTTDMEELDDNSEFHNYYLSVIVNNMNDIVAKVAFRGTNTGFVCKDENGNSWDLRVTEPRATLFTFDCEIKHEEVVTVDKDFEDRLLQVIKIAGEKEAKMKEQWNAKKDEQRSDQEETFWWNNPHDSLQNPFSFGEDETIDEEDVMEAFIIKCLRLGNISTGSDGLENALEDVESSFRRRIYTPIQYADTFMEKYPSILEQHFNSFGHVDTESVVSITEDFIDVLNECLREHPWVRQLTFRLERMLDKFVKV